jgi:cytochrome P450
MLGSIGDEPRGASPMLTEQSTAPPTRPLPHPRWRHQPRLLRRIFADPQPVLDELRAAHGPVVGLGAGPVRMAIVGDPSALRELFATSTDAFRWGHKFNALGFVVGAESMIVSDGDDHQRRRSSVQAAFSRRRLNGWIPMIVEQTDLAVDRLITRIEPAGDVVDLYPVGRRLVLEIVVRSLFGERLADRAEEIGDLFQRPQDYLESPAVRQLPHPVPFTRRARVRDDRRALDAIIDAEIARRRALPPPDRLDVLDALVGDTSLSDGEIRDQVATLIGAGYDTTSATLAWMLLRTASCDGLFASLREEADRVLGPIGTEPVADEHSLRRLELAERTMRETTRLHPAGVISPREAARDVVVGGYRIPAGTLILWSAYLAGRDSDAWDDPLRFDPERFTSPSPERAALARMAWVPFGRGARNCIGFALAQMELTLIAARLAQRLDIEPTGAPLPKPVGMVVNRPAGGAVLRVSARRG